MLKDVLQKAQKEGYAIGQFNFSTLEQLRGILDASKGLKTPVILGMSEGELKYMGLEEVIALVEISKNKYGVEAYLNLDHGKDRGLIKKCIDYGFSAVHFDGSSLPLEKNTEYVKTIVEYAHKKNVLVEGELEEIGGKKRYSLEEIQDFTEKTGIDSLAIAIGSVHGLGKVTLDFERLKKIKEKVSQFLVLHGGSGIPNSQIKKAIKLGIVKININTELRVAWREGFLNALKGGEIKPYNIVPIVQKNIQKKVAEKIKLFKAN
ncbi:class II fructose-bisphosphate aldolase [Patescibacteria group bacterium]|nr:class II fructose-bisphosphate aldolase [Patescibacteria group bacterium]